MCRKLAHDRVSHVVLVCIGLAAAVFLAVHQLAGSATEKPIPTQTDTLWPTGLFESRQAPLAHAYRIENQWQFDQNGTHVQVFAGSLDSDPGQGVIVILTSAGTQVSSTPAAYVTPQKAGAVRIVNASATELQLVAQGGQRFQFDLASRAFVPLTALPQWPSGVFDVGQAPFPAGQPFPANLIDVANVWQMSTSQGFVRVFAGAYKADPAQGVVVIQRVNGALWSEDDTYGGPNTVKASATKDGSLRIVAAAQDTVSLIGEDGKAFQLTLASNQLAQP